MATHKPTHQETEIAIQQAEAMRDQGADEYGLAALTLYLSERNRALEDLRRKAEYYLRFGMGEKELTDLRVALADIRKQDERSDDDSSLFSGE